MFMLYDLYISIVSSVSLPCDDIFYRILLYPFSSICFPCFLFSDRVPGLIWFDSVYIVTAARIVADLVMRDKQRQQQINFPTSTFSQVFSPLTGGMVRRLSFVQNFLQAGKTRLI